MSRRPVRNFNLNVIVLNKATIFEYYLYSPYTNLHICIPSPVQITYVCQSSRQQNVWGYLVECNLHYIVMHTAPVDL